MQSALAVRSLHEVCVLAVDEKQTLKITLKHIVNNENYNKNNMWNIAFFEGTVDGRNPAPPGMYKPL